MSCDRKILLAGIPSLAVLAAATIFILHRKGVDVAAAVERSTITWTTETDLHATDDRSEIPPSESADKIRKRTLDNAIADFREGRFEYNRRFAGEFSRSALERVDAAFPEQWFRGSLLGRISRVDTPPSDFWPPRRGGPARYVVELELDLQRKPLERRVGNSYFINSPRVDGTIRIEIEHELELAGLPSRAFEERVRADAVADVIVRVLRENLEAP